MGKSLLPNCLLFVMSCCQLFCCCHTNQTNAPPSTGYPNSLSDRAICTKLVSRPETSLIHSALGVLAVGRCPPSASDTTIKDLCHHLGPERHIRPDTVPVFDNQGILYLNQYCLMCNSAPDQAKLVFSALTNVTVSCSRSVNEPWERHSLDNLLQTTKNGSLVLPVGCRGTFLVALAHPGLVDCCPINETLCRAKFTEVTTVDIVFNFRIDFFNLSGRSRIPNEMDGADRSSNLWNSSSWTGFSFPRRVTRVSLLVFSMLSLVCLIAIYSCCCLSGLRNRPGYLLVSHCFALLLVYGIDLLELTEIPSVWLLQQHWVYSLTVFAANAAFCWALLFGCDLLRALSGLSVSGSGGGGASQPSDRRSRLISAARLALIGWGVPLLFAAAPMVTQRVIRLRQIEQQQLNATDVGITNWSQLQLGIVFAPWAATLALNFLALAAIWRRIFLAAQSARQGGAGFNATTSTRGFAKAKRLAITALKVSVLLGVCWLPFCLSISLGLSHESIGFLAGQLCRSSQGLLLLAAFGSSARVRKQLADRLTKRSTSSGPGSGLAVKGDLTKGRRRNTRATTSGGSDNSRPQDDKTSRRLLGPAAGQKVERNDKLA